MNPDLTSNESSREALWGKPGGPRRMSVSFSNLGTQGDSTVRLVPDGRIFRGEAVTAAGELAAVFVELAPMEVQVLA